MSQATDEVLALERRFWTEANNPGFYERNVADEGLTVIEPAGFIEKRQAVQMSAAGAPWKDVEMKDVQVREVTPECVILAYHGQGRSERDDKPYRGSIASVYIRRDGRWQLALSAHQPWTPKE